MFKQCRHNHLNRNDCPICGQREKLPTFQTVPGAISPKQLIERETANVEQLPTRDELLKYLKMDLNKKYSEIQLIINPDNSITINPIR